MQVFNFVASICSILGLIVAFWQIFSVKKQVEKTYNALEELRNVFVDHKVDILLNQITVIQEELTGIIGNLNKPGFSEKRLNDDIQKIIIDLDKCDNELPEKHLDISKGIEESVKNLRAALSANEVKDEYGKTKRDYLLDAEGYLKGCIHGLKKASEKALDGAVDIIARANSENIERKSRGE